MRFGSVVNDTVFKPVAPAQADTSDRGIHLAAVPIYTWIPRSDVLACEGVAKVLFTLYRVARVFRNFRLVGVSRTKRSRIC